MKGWKRWMLIGGTVCAVGVGIVQGIVKPAAEQYLAPYVKEQLNNAIHGQATYDNLHLRWNGTIQIDNLQVFDSNKKLVGKVETLGVGVDLKEAICVLFSKSSGEALLGAIEINNGQIYVREIEKGKWNLSSLVKESDPDKQQSFRGSVALHHIDVLVTTMEGKSVQFRSLDGTLLAKGYPVLEGAFTSLYEGHDVILKGTYNVNTHDANGFIKAENIDVKPIFEMMPDLPMKLDSGVIKNAHILFSKLDKKWELNGALDVSHVDGQYNEYMIRDGKSHLVFHGDMIRVSDTSVLLNHQYITARGDIGIQNIKNPTINAFFKTNGFNLSALPIDMEGIVNGEVRMYGSLEDLQGTASLDIRNIHYKDIVIDRGVIQGRYDNNTIWAQDIDLVVDQGSLKGVGEYHIDSDSYKGEVKFSNLPLGLVQNFVSVPIIGAAYGEARISGIKSDITDLYMRAKAHEFSYDGIHVNTLDTLITGGHDTYQVAYANGIVKEGTFTAYGTIDRQIDLHVFGENLPFSMFQDRIEKPVDGKFSTQLYVNGSKESLQGNVEVSTSGGSFGDLGFGAGSIKGKLIGNRVSITEGILQLAQGEAEVTGDIGIHQGGPVDIKAEIEAVRIEELVKPFVDLPVTGYGTLTSHITGTLDNLKVGGLLHLWDGSVYGKLFNHINADYTWQDRNLFIEDIYINTYGAIISGGGSMVDNQLDFSFRGEGIDVDPWLNDVPGDIHGSVAMEGHIGGIITNPNFEGTVKADEIFVNNTPIYDVRSRVYGDKHVIHVQEAAFRGQNQSQYKGNGTLQIQGDYPIIGNISVEGGSVAHLLRLSQVNLPNLDGELTGLVNIGGTVQTPSITVKGYIDKTRIADNILGRMELDGTLVGDKVTINKLEVPVKGGLLAAGGSADLDGNLDIQVASKDVPIEVLLPLTGKDIPLKGRMNFILNGTGTTLNPKLELSAELKDGSYNNVQIDEAYMLATMSDKVVHVQQAVGKKGAYALKAHGDIPIGAINQKLITDKDMSDSMNLVIDVNEADLGVLPLIFKSVKEGSGPLSGKITLTGPATDIQAQGHIELTKGTLKIAGIDKPLTNMNGQVNLKDHALDILMTANMGKGTAGLTGSATWFANEVKTYFGGLQLDKLEMKSDYYTGPLQGEFYIHEVNGLPTLSGKAEIDNTTLAIPMDMESTPGGSPLGLDVTVKAGKNVRLYNSSLYDMKVMGEATFKGTTNNPEASGRFRVTSGTIKYLNNRFKITEGFANFVSGSILPELRISAESLVQNYRILIAAKGPANQMELQLNSEPHLDHRQIVSLLTFGRSDSNDSGISSKDANMLLAASLQNFAFGYVENILRNNLGLDLVNITTGSLTPGKPDPKDADNFNVIIGKYVLPKFMITYGQGLNNVKNAYGFQYDVTRRIGITGWQSSDHKSYIGGQWRIKF